MTITVNSAIDHPVAIQTSNVVNGSTNYYSGATPQNLNSGTITLTVPSSGAPCTLYVVLFSDSIADCCCRFYICTEHHFYGMLHVVGVCGRSAWQLPTFCGLMLCLQLDCSRACRFQHSSIAAAVQHSPRQASERLQHR